MKFVLCFFIAFTPLKIFPQKLPELKPRLVVVLMVDELNSDQLFTWQKKFEKGGITRMINQGTFIPHLSVNSISSYYGNSVASFYSGATPAIHGVISDKWMDRFNQKTVHAVYGEQNNDSIPKASCNQMLASTISDELKRLYPNYSKIRGIGMSSDILNWAMGHGNEGYYCIDIKKGEIRNSNNLETPFWVREFNLKKFADVYKLREWGPINNINDYYESKFHRATLPDKFLYRFIADADYERLIFSPFGNVMIRDFAASMIINEGLGKDDYPDLLTISFSLKPGVDVNCKPMDAEVEDMIVRLDHEITGLIRLIEETVGLENSLIILSGAHNPGVYPDEYKAIGAPSGVFSGKKALSLLNLYFMAQYGQGKWVYSYNDGAFYINAKLVEEKGLSMKEMRNKSAEFLLQMSGVGRTHTFDQLISEKKIMADEVIHQSFHAKRSGDVIIELEPGWVEELCNGEFRARPSLSRDLPIIFFGGQIPAKTIKQSYRVIDVAPTISTILNMSYPNGNIGTPIKEIFEK